MPTRPPPPAPGPTDTVPAMLTPGEYVIKRDAVRRIGVKKLDQLNQGYQEGGSVKQLVSGDPDPVAAISKIPWTLPPDPSRSSNPFQLHSREELPPKTQEPPPGKVFAPDASAVPVEKSEAKTFAPDAPEVPVEKAKGDQPKVFAPNAPEAKVNQQPQQQQPAPPVSMASRELPPSQQPPQQSPQQPQQQPPQQQPTVYPKIAEDQPDTEEQLRTLINQGHSPGAAQAIVSGQEPKTLSGNAPAPKTAKEPAKPSEPDSPNDTLLKSQIARSLDTDRLDDPRVIAEFNRRKAGDAPQTSAAAKPSYHLETEAGTKDAPMPLYDIVDQDGKLAFATTDKQVAQDKLTELSGSETGAKSASPKIQLPSPGTGDQTPTTIDGKRIYGTATSFARNYDGSIDTQDNGRGFFGGVDTRNPNLKAVAVPVDVLEKTFGHFAQLNSKGGYDALDTPEAKAIIQQIKSAHVELPDANGKIHKFPIVDIQASLAGHPGKVLDLTYGAAKDMGFTDNHAVSYQIVGGDGKPYPIPDIELTGKGGGEGKGKGKGGDTLVPMVPSETNAPAPAQAEVPLSTSGGGAHIGATPEAAPSQGGWFGGIPWPFRGRTPQAQAAQAEEEEEEEQTPLTTKLITRGSSQPRAITDAQNVLPGAPQSAQLPAPAAPTARPQLPPPAAPSSLPAQPSAKTVELSLLQKPEIGKVQPVAPAKPKTLLPPPPSAPAPKKPIAAAKAPVPPAKAPPATTVQSAAPAKGGMYTGAPPGSTHGQANPPAFKALSPGTKLPEAVKEHARLVSEDDPRVKKQKDGAIKGEHFVEGDPVHDRLLGGLPEGKHGPQRQMLAQAEQAIAEKRPMHISYLSAPKEAQRYPTRESRTVQYEEHTPEARLMGTTVGQLVGHSLIPVSVGVSLPRKAGEPHQSYIQGISTNILANNFGHLNEKLAALGVKTPYKSLGSKFYNDLEGYYSNLNAGHTATGRGHALGTEELPNVPDPTHVPYKLKRREADFINTVINNTMAFAGHEDAQKLRELAKANGTLITPEGETNRMRHHIEQHDPGWRNRVLEPSIRSFKTGLIVAHHQDERYFPETIRPGKEFQNLTRAIQHTSEQGRPDVPIATSLHHTYQDNAQINKIERDFSDHKIDEAEAHRRLEAMGEDPDEYRFVGGSGGLVTPYEEDPEAITPEEHTQMKRNLREQWINGKIDVEKYRQKAAEVPLPTKPAGFAKGGLVKPQDDPDDLAGQTVSTTAAPPPATPPPDQAPPDQDDEPPAAAPTTPPAAPSAKPQPSVQPPAAKPKPQKATPSAPGESSEMVGTKPPEEVRTGKKSAAEAKAPAKINPAIQKQLGSRPEDEEQGALWDKVALRLGKQIKGAIPLRPARKANGDFKTNSLGQPEYEEETGGYHLANAPILGKKALGYDKKGSVNKAPEGTVDKLDPGDLNYLNPTDRLRVSHLNEISAIGTFADELGKEYDRVEKEIPEALKAKNWYNDTEGFLKKHFGADADMVANLLAATSARTGVKTNYGFAMNAYHRYARGDYDRHIDLYQKAYDMKQREELAQHVLDAGIHHELPKSEAHAMALYIKHHGILPVQHDLDNPELGGPQYGMNSLPVLKVLAKTWLNEVGGPKTPRYTGNMTGRTIQSTGDMWVGRQLRRLGFEGHTKEPWLVQAPAEPGLTNLDFAIQELAHRKAAEKRGLEPRQHQAILWTSEIKHWLQKEWAEGGDPAERDYRPMLKEYKRPEWAQRTAA